MMESSKIRSSNIATYEFLWILSTWDCMLTIVCRLVVELGIAIMCAWLVVTAHVFVILHSTPMRSISVLLYWKLAYYVSFLFQQSFRS